jgi:hypothetical protein
MIASLPSVKICFSPVSRGCSPSALFALSVPTCSTLAAGTAIVGRRL